MKIAARVLSIALSLTLSLTLLAPPALANTIPAQDASQSTAAKNRKSYLKHQKKQQKQWKHQQKQAGKNLMKKHPSK
ncbi:MAG: hypothetical protein WDN23_11625 [Edaphobacter sp.]